jgi:hypothetical protein
MATVVATFDTVSKQMSVTVDGKELPDASYVSMGMRYDCCDPMGADRDPEYYCTVSTRSVDPDNKMSLSQTIVASAAKGGDAPGREVEGLPEFRLVEPSLRERIAAHMKAAR